MKDIDWSKWGWCPTCEQTPGGQCFDMRYVKDGRPVGGFMRNKPHKDREKVESNA